MKMSMHSGLQAIYGSECANLQPVAFDYVPARHRTAPAGRCIQRHTKTDLFCHLL